jgi:hypothetical protein
MQGRGTFVAAVVSVACALAVGCGSDADNGSDAPVDESTTVSAEPTLTRKQFSELEQLYRAIVPLERSANRAGPESSHRFNAEMARACRQIDRRDPLLAAMDDACQRTVDSVAALAGLDCDTLASCEALMTETAESLRELLAAMRKLEPVVEREVANAACRDVLLAPDQTAIFEEAADALDGLIEAVDASDPDAIEGANADVQAAFAAIDDGPSARDELRLFRASCRPAAG